MSQENSPLVNLFVERASAIVKTSEKIEFPLQDDNFTVSSYPKAGTTWIQQIVHQLRTGGDENFDEISLVIPYILPESIFDGSRMMHHRPRVFKTHFIYEDIVPQGGKHIYTVRNPEDTLWSFYKFLPPIVCLPEVTIPQFYFNFFRIPHRNNYWNNVLSWWHHRDQSDKVLFLHFEDLKENLDHCVRHIANFLNIPLTEELLNLVLERSSFQYMKENGYLFDDRFEIPKLRSLLGLEKEESPMGPGKVREGGGQVGQGKKSIPQEIRDDLQKMWEDTVMPSTGCITYEELRAKSSLLNKPLA